MASAGVRFFCAANQLGRSPKKTLPAKATFDKADDDSGSESGINSDAEASVSEGEDEEVTEARESEGSGTDSAPTAAATQILYRRRLSKQR